MSNDIRPHTPGATVFFTLGLVPRGVGIWQKRFWDIHIPNEADFNAHVRYCWINPVKHGLAARPEDWPYSSYHRDEKGNSTL